jgi:short-subunit dehydrogenase
MSEQTHITAEADLRPLALVTGASSGIGLALARQFAEHGFDLVVAAEDDELDAAVAELSRTGADVVAVKVDLSRGEGVERLHQALRDSHRHVDAAALNAGVGVGGPFAETDLDADLQLVDLNVRSTVHLAKLVVRDMLSQGSGRLLFTSSIAATAPGPYHATYAASKAFVQSFAEALRHELEDTGIAVTALMPGPTDTEFFDRADMEDTKIATGRKDDPDEVARQGFEALFEDKDHVVAGAVANKVQATASRHLPPTKGAAAQARMTEPGSGSE